MIVKAEEATWGAESSSHLKYVEIIVKVDQVDYPQGKTRDFRVGAGGSMVDAPRD